MKTRFDVYPNVLHHLFNIPWFFAFARLETQTT